MRRTHASLVCYTLAIGSCFRAVLSCHMSFAASLRNFAGQQTSTCRCRCSHGNTRSFSSLSYTNSQICRYLIPVFSSFHHARTSERRANPLLVSVSSCARDLEMWWIASCSFFGYVSLLFPSSCLSLFWFRAPICGSLKFVYPSQHGRLSLSLYL